jgi:hypothetical protein
VAQPVYLIQSSLDFFLHHQGDVERCGRRGLSQQLAYGLIDLRSVDALATRFAMLDSVPLTAYSGTGSVWR